MPSLKRTVARLVLPAAVAGAPVPAQKTADRGNGRGQNLQETGNLPSGTSALPSDRKKDQPSLAEMYRAITSELG